jgi:hypothetical protein
MKLVISQPMFFPWIGFFEQIKLCDVYVHYNDVQYSKGGFTNRVQVKSSEGSKWLTVPLKNLHLGQRIDQVEINNELDWRTTHLDLLKRCYETAPYCLEMLKLVETVYSRDWELLDDLSQTTLNTVCEYFGFIGDIKFINIKDLNIGGASSERVLATTLKVKADTYITGHGASKYLDHSIFENSGVRVEYMDYQKTPYPQLFGEFTPYVSILDLIANVGKDGINWIHSETIYWKDFVNE